MEPELAQSRLGKMTASMAYTIMGEKLSNKGIQDLVVSLAFERHFGSPEEDGYHSKAMERGNEMEPRALVWYTFETQRLPERPLRTIDHPTIPWVAATPDGTLLPERVVEAKALLHKAWMEARERRSVPSRYRWQCQWQMWVCGVPLCDFVVWHPVAGGFIVEVRADPADQAAMAARAVAINNLVNNWLETLK